MKLGAYLVSKRNRVVQEWYELAILDYPAETATFLREEMDSFTNPVGISLRNILTALFDEILYLKASDNVNNLLCELLKVRAVQDFPPSRAIAFIPKLKYLLREHLEKEFARGDYEEDFQELESRIELLTFLAFDIYVECREKLYQIRIKELKNSIPRVFRELNETVCLGAIERKNSFARGSEG